MVMKYVFSGLLLCLLAGCSATPSPPVQKAQKARITPQATLNMAQLCKDNAAVRYSTGVRQVDISHFEQFQGSYELSARLRGMNVLSVLLTRTDSFCIFPCAKRAHGGAYFRNFP
ncbi:outer membrane lipoprotein [Klebsiella michiganensis]|uniref:Outer membrane lipoprotein n=1 Tax=Klebsiella michiganensis TaxID=1134687 RepID=A0A7H4M435_9ENTR|nr:outer membrane lipoprotein [Klebsiella michiganensis]